MKILKYSLLSILLISPASFATEVPTEQVVLPTLGEVVSFCSSDNSCSSIIPVIHNNDLNYAVKYEKIIPPVTNATDPTNGEDD